MPTSYLGPGNFLSRRIGRIQFLAVIFYCLCSLTSFSTAETSPRSSSSSPANGKKKHEHFMPLVSFQCGYRNKYMNAEGRWQDDPSSAAGCLHGKYDILKYCKRVYPNEQITNIVEYSHLTRIDHWCREDGTDCHHQFTVRPFRCISGEFITESLQVPQRCHFSHIAGKDKCNDYKFWNVRAEEECDQKKEPGTNQPMRLRSFAILEPCGLGMFRGVEFVCCPKELEERIEKKVIDLETERTATEKKTQEDEEDEDDEEDEEEYSEEDEEEEEGKKGDGAKKDESGKGSAEQDPYFKDDPSGNEHERFREAEERLEKKHRKKVTKVITEWSELFERYNKMKEKDPKGAEQYKREMTAKFRKTVASLEAENREQRKQIEELHDERVQTGLNEKKRQATHEYRAALAIQVGQTNKQNVLRTLKNYIRAEEKDRQHMLNRYRHLLRSDPEAALSFESVLLHRLRYIDLRINGTLAMLRDFPELEKEIRPVAIGFWKSYRKENTPEALDEEAEAIGKKSGHYLSDEERNERLIRLYKQNFERKHPGAHLAMQLQEAAKQRVNSRLEATTKSTSGGKMVVALKDVLKEDDASSMEGERKRGEKKGAKKEEELEEDSDEDQFEEDEDGDGKTTIVQAPPTTKAPVKIHVELLNGEAAAKGGEKAKKLPSSKEEEAEKTKPAKLMSSKAESGDDDENSSEEEEEDEDEDVAATNEAESEYVASNDKKANNDEGGAKRKHIRIDVEPIVLAPSPDELRDGPIEYAKHHRSFLTHKTEDELSDSTIVGRWLAQANLLLGLIALTFAAMAIIILLRRRRNRHPGFIEVDVCTPEESHVAGMQVNGYENPTYTFFEGKQQC